ncbi:MAG: MBOAT family protein [Pseudomonadota bacterium]
MLFNAYEFIFAFLPITLAGFFFLGANRGLRPAVAWLVAASLFFYGYWRPVYLLLIGGSIVFNYLCGLGIARMLAAGRARRAKGLMVFGVVANLTSIGVFKYADFVIGNVNAVAGTAFSNLDLLLPLAISFFTFQQISYLADAYNGEPVERDFLSYALFVTFFPQLIAGPIVHHSEMLPQFRKPGIGRVNWEDIAVGVSLFALGLFKKTIIADNIATFSDPVFAAANAGETITLIEGWVGALAYTAQLYFDFSGYSDMALGLARMFGIRLPLNFNSPYKARDISDFWRRWHMTLSRFLRDYLYIALGGNRAGQVRRYINLGATMLLGGLWHGAGWTFVIWGGLHGGYLIINHAWNWLWYTRRGVTPSAGWLSVWRGRLLTFLAVVVAWVYFRAESLDAAHAVLAGMTGINGAVIPAHWQLYFGPLAPVVEAVGFRFGVIDTVQRISVIPWILGAFAIAFFAPNTQQILHAFDPALMTDRKQRIAPTVAWLTWQPSRVWACVIAVLAAWAVFGRSTTSQFLYFNF